MEFQLDVNITIVSLNYTRLGEGTKLLWNADNLGDGDHQLWMAVRQNGMVVVDYFEYVVPLLHFVTGLVFQ